MQVTLTCEWKTWDNFLNRAPDSWRSWRGGNNHSRYRKPQGRSCAFCELETKYMEYRVYMTSLKKDETQSMTIAKTISKQHAEYSKSQKCKRVNHFIVKKCFRGRWKDKPTYVRLIKANRMLKTKNRWLHNKIFKLKTKVSTQTYEENPKSKFNMGNLIWALKEQLKQEQE